jgi:hypothetical protein
MLRDPFLLSNFTWPDPLKSSTISDRVQESLDLPACNQSWAARSEDALTKPPTHGARSRQIIMHYQVRQQI